MKLANDLNASGFGITNLRDGVNPQDAVTKAQLDAGMQGYAWKAPVRAATTANITLSGTQTIDGVALAVGDRVLVKDQSAPAANGIYLVATGAWPRATDMDQSSEALGATVFVSEGTVSGNKQYQMTTDAPITIGTTALVWMLINGGSSFVAGNGITLSGGTIAVDPAVVVRKVGATIGDGTATTVSVVHNLNTLDVQVVVREVATGAEVLVDNVANGVNTVQLTFGVAPTTGQYRVVIQG